MVNGVLRNIQRNGVSSFEDIKDDSERLAIETSHPIWLVKTMGLNNLAMKNKRNV